jgi:hypothetical protein
LLQEETSTSLSKVENVILSWGVMIMSKVERDIKLTERFGSYVTRRTIKGINQVVSTVSSIGM